MKYETYGGSIKDTEHDKTILRYLKVGDRFSAKTGKGLWEVWDEKCRYNGSAGSAMRKCKNLITGMIDHKLCRIEVIKRSK